MTTLSIHAYLVHPGKNAPIAPALSGSRLNPTGKLFDILTDIFHATPDQRDFEITFNPAKDGSQQNDCRDIFLAHQTIPTEETALPIAERLQNATDNRSGMGLLFIMSGQHGTRLRLVISRFPANEAIMAEVTENKLDVEYLEQVFIKRMSAYKAIMLEDQNPKDNYWKGMATDRQAGGSPENISNYWIEDFLSADFSDTPQAGTRRLAEALREAIRANPVMSVKAEIAAAVSLASSALGGKPTSVEDFCSHFGLSHDATETIRARLSKPGLATKQFVFDAKEFRVKIPFRTVELENGAILTAPSDKFGQVFKSEEMDNGIVEYRTRGRVADQRMRGK